MDDRLKYYGYLIELTSKRMKQYLQRSLKSANVMITVDQWVVLNALYQYNGASQFEIAQKIHKDQPTLTRIVDLLETKEYVRRVPNTEDRRKMNVSLTQLGRQKINEVKPLIEEYRSIGWKNLDDQDFENLIRILNTIYQNFEGH